MRPFEPGIRQAATSFAVLWLLLASPAVPAATSTVAEQAALRAAEVTGMAIYRHDHAAAVATDALLAAKAGTHDPRVRGWISEETPQGLVVTFFDATPAALYRVSVSPEGTAAAPVQLDAPQPLTPSEAGAAAARQLALSAKFQPCSDSYNPVVLPEGDRWVVYLIPGTTRNDIVPLGGTYRVTVDESKITGQRGFTRSCITLPDSPDAVALFVTHLMDPVPTEAHVYWSLWAKKPIHVSTTDGSIWKVDGNHIQPSN